MNPGRPQSTSEVRDIGLILVLGVVTALIFKFHFGVQREFGLAFVMAFPVVLFAVSKGFRYGALASVVAGAIYGTILLFRLLTSNELSAPRLDFELINLAIIFGSGFGLGLVSEYVNFRDPFKEEATIVETFVPDEETGLYNFKSFRWMLRGEIRRVQRYNRPASLIFWRVVNLDDFQRRYDYNEEVKLFKEIGLHLRNMLRESDYIGKHADNEMGIVLPETNAEGSSIVHSRMIDTHEQLLQKLRRGWDEIDLDFECSQATFPKDAGNLEELIDVIDSRYRPI
jgi:diguanylate cyclase (GGDEF)-like protein